MSFLVTPLRFDRDAMTAYILAIPKTGMKPNPNTGAVWNPVGVTWHNTAGPTLAQWAAYSEAQRESWGANYDAWCRATEHWHAGPHFCATPSGWSFVLGDLQADGIHCTCDNADHFGVETVGDFAVGAENPLSGAGALAVSEAANIIASLCVRFEFDPTKAVKFHRDCPRDGHPCPGAQLTTEHAIGLVVARMAEINGAKPTVTPTPIAATAAPVAQTMPVMVELPVWPPVGHPFFTKAAQVYNAWKALGVSNPFALAMTTQAEFESAFQSSAVGDQGTAYNIYQWHWVPRGQSILAATGIDVRTETSLSRIVSAAWWELNHTETKARDAIAAATTAHDASVAACTLFEGAGAPMAAERRGVGAERWATWIDKNASFVTVNPAK